MSSAWTQSGKIVVENGAVVICDECPCEIVCEPCEYGTAGSVLQIEFLAGTNVSGDEAACAGDCDDWAAAWDGDHLTMAQKTAFVSDPDYAYLNLAGVLNNCMYLRTEGLPCGATAMLSVLNYIQPRAYATGWTYICWPGGKAARLSWSIRHLDDPEFDHKRCLDWYQAGEGVYQCVVDFVGESIGPCDFEGIEITPTKLVIAMLP